MEVMSRRSGRGDQRDWDALTRDDAAAQRDAKATVRDDTACDRDQIARARGADTSSDYLAVRGAIARAEQRDDAAARRDEAAARRERAAEADGLGAKELAELWDRARADRSAAAADRVQARAERRELWEVINRIADQWRSESRDRAAAATDRDAARRDRDRAREDRMAAWADREQSALDRAAEARPGERF